MGIITVVGLIYLILSILILINLKWSIITNREIYTVGYIIIFASLILITREVYHFIKLPSIYDDKYKTIDFFKYKQNTLPFFYIWFLLLISGIGLIKKLNIGWITFNSIIWIGLTQFLLFSYHGIDTPLIIIAMGFFLILFILITRRLFHKLLKDYFKINKKRLILNYIYVIIVTGLYWVIDIYNYLIK